MATDPEHADEMGEGDEQQVINISSSQLLRRPDLLAALQQGDLSGLKGTLGPFGAPKILPPNVKRRVKALKKIQLEATPLEAKFYEEVHALEIKYHQLYLPFYEKRQEIVSGKHEPSAEECDFPSDDEKDELADELQTKVKIEDAAKENESDMPDAESGIPEFWLTIFKNVALLNEMVQPHDEPILKHLQDIKVEFLKADPMGFILEFHFSPNEYFSNTVLTKTYHMSCVPDEANPFSFEGPEIFKCFGCKIDWNKGKNVTVKTVKKRQKHKVSGCSRALAKTVQNDSFFNFFNPPQVPDDQEAELDSETQELLTSDFEIGHYIRERIVPRAVLFYTGEALEEEEDDFDEDEEDEEAEEEEDDGEEEEDDEIEEVGKGGGGKRQLRAKKGIKNGGQPSECNQQ